MSKESFPSTGVNFQAARGLSVGTLTRGSPGAGFSQSFSSESSRSFSVKSSLGNFKAITIDRSGSISGNLNRNISPRPPVIEVYGGRLNRQSAKDLFTSTRPQTIAESIRSYHPDRTIPWSVVTKNMGVQFSAKGGYQPFGSAEYRINSHFTNIQDKSVADKTQMLKSALLTERKGVNQAAPADSFDKPQLLRAGQIVSEKNQPVKSHLRKINNNQKAEITNLGAEQKDTPKAVPKVAIRLNVAGNEIDHNIDASASEVKRILPTGIEIGKFAQKAIERQARRISTLPSKEIAIRVLDKTHARSIIWRSQAAERIKVLSSVSSREFQALKPKIAEFSQGLIATAGFGLDKTPDLRKEVGRTVQQLVLHSAEDSSLNKPKVLLEDKNIRFPAEGRSEFIDSRKVKPGEDLVTLTEKAGTQETQPKLGILETKTPQELVTKEVIDTVAFQGVSGLEAKTDSATVYSLGYKYIGNKPQSGNIEYKIYPIHAGKRVSQPTGNVRLLNAADTTKSVSPTEIIFNAPHLWGDPETAESSPQIEKQGKVSVSLGTGSQSEVSQPSDIQTEAYSQTKPVLKVALNPDLTVSRETKQLLKVQLLRERKIDKTVTNAILPEVPEDEDEKLKKLIEEIERYLKEEKRRQEILVEVDTHAQMAREERGEQELEEVYQNRGTVTGAEIILRLRAERENERSEVVKGLPVPDGQRDHNIGEYDPNAKYSYPEARRIFIRGLGRYPAVRVSAQRTSELLDYSHLSRAIHGQIPQLNTIAANPNLAISYN